MPKAPRPPVPAAAQPIRLPACPELAAWRVLGGDVAHLVEAVLAAQGDGASSELVQLQHRLVALLSGPAVSPPVGSFSDSFSDLNSSDFFTYDY
jgi:hypothetical protein